MYSRENVPSHTRANVPAGAEYRDTREIPQRNASGDRAWRCKLAASSLQVHKSSKAAAPPRVSGITDRELSRALLLFVARRIFSRRQSLARVVERVEPPERCISSLDAVATRVAKI